MITDTNNIMDFFTQSMLGAVSGDWMLLAVLFIAALAMTLVFAKAKASTSVAVIAAVGIMFSFVVDGLMFIWWLAIIGAIFVLINGLRKWITSQS